MHNGFLFILHLPWTRRSQKPMQRAGACLFKPDVRQQSTITLSRAFTDDLTVITSSVVPGSRWILPSLEELISWARVSSKTIKLRAIVLTKGKVPPPPSFLFFFLGWQSNSIHQLEVWKEPVQSSRSLRIAAALQSTTVELENWLCEGYRSGITGRSTTCSTRVSMCEVSTVQNIDGSLQKMALNVMQSVQHWTFCEWKKSSRSLRHNGGFSFTENRVTLKRLWGQTGRKSLFGLPGKAWKVV